MLRRPVDRATASLIGALGVVVFVFSWIALHYGFLGRGQFRDTPLYQSWGDAIVHHGLVPYRDFGVDYPPGALPVFVIPSLVAGPDHFWRFQQVFDLEIALAGIAMVAVVAFALAAQRVTVGRMAAGVALAAAAPLLVGSIMLSRFDLFPATLTAAAVAMLVVGRARIAFVLLGLVVVVKLYPVILVPIAIGYVWRRRGRREAMVCSALFVTVLAVGFIPFLVIAPHGVYSSLILHPSGSLQVETLGSSVILAAHQLFGTSVTRASPQLLVGTAPDLFSAYQKFAGAVLLVVILARFLRRRPEPEALVLACAASLTALVALGTLLSPQYLIWLVPIVAMLCGPRSLAAGALLATAMVLTHILVPHHYNRLVNDLAPTEIWLLLTRNLLLVALTALLVWPERRGRPVYIRLLSGSRPGD